MVLGGEAGGLGDAAGAGGGDLGLCVRGYAKLGEREEGGRAEGMGNWQMSFRMEKRSGEDIADYITGNTTRDLASDHAWRESSKFFGVRRSNLAMCVNRAGWLTFRHALAVKRRIGPTSSATGAASRRPPASSCWTKNANASTPTWCGGTKAPGQPW